MFNKVSPLFVQDLLIKINHELWRKYDGRGISKYLLVEDYISRWSKRYEKSWVTGREQEYWNFDIQYNSNNKIDLFQTLRNIPNETLLQIAIDLGIEVPALVPAIPEKIELKIEELGDKFQLVHTQITEAIESCYKKPDDAIFMINTALETTCKRILEGNNDYNAKDHSTELIKKITTHIGLTYDTNAPRAIKNITSSLYNIGKSIDDLRANWTSGQGKDTTQKIITDSNYAFFCVNAIASVILFLLSTEKPVKNHAPEDDIPF